MNKFHGYIRLTRGIPLLVCLVVAGCGGGKDTIFGGDVAVARPTVTSSVPAAAATNVSTNTTAITGTFSEPVALTSGAASFTVTCAAPCASPAGTVTLDSTGRTASFTLNNVTLAPLTAYTATISGVTSTTTALGARKPVRLDVHDWPAARPRAAQSAAHRPLDDEPWSNAGPGDELGAYCDFHGRHGASDAHRDKLYGDVRVAMRRAVRDRGLCGRQQERGFFA